MSVELEDKRDQKNAEWKAPRTGDKKEDNFGRIDNAKIEEIYQNIGFDKNDLDKSFEEREQSLKKPKNPEEKLTLFETLMLHKQNIKKEIDDLDWQIRYLEPHKISMLPKHYEEFKKTFKEKYNVEDESELVKTDTALYAVWNGAIRPREDIRKKLYKREMGIFTTPEKLGFYPKDKNNAEEELANKTKKFIEIKKEDLKKQMENVETKLQKFTL